MSDTHFDHLVGLIYESAIDPRLWRETMNVLAHQVGADAFHLLAWSRSRQSATLSVTSQDDWDSEAMNRPNGRADVIGFRHPSVRQTDAQEINPHSLYLDDPLPAHDTLYQDFLLRDGMRYVLGGRLTPHTNTDVNLALSRVPERRAFEPAHEKMFARLLPHFSRSLRLMEQHQTVAQSGELAAIGHETGALAVIVVTSLGEMLYCNRNGEALLNTADVLQLKQGIVTCPFDRYTQHFGSALDMVIKTGRPLSLLLHASTRPDERFSVTLTPLPRRNEHPQSHANESILCLVMPLDRKRIATAQQLIELFGLTAAEARLARALTIGDTLECYAQENDLKLPTVKSQLHAAFEKTRTDRQAALVRLIAGIPAVRIPG